MNYNPLQGPGDGVYQPIDPNPNVDQDAGFMNADDPNPPAGSYQPAGTAPYYPGGGIPVTPPPGGGGAMAPAGGPGMRGLLQSDLVRNAIAGAVGAVVHSWQTSKKVKLDASLVKGAIAGIISVGLARKYVNGHALLAAGAAGGYAAAKWIG